MRTDPTWRLQGRSLYFAKMRLYPRQSGERYVNISRKGSEDHTVLGKLRHLHCVFWSRVSPVEKNFNRCVQLLFLIITALCLACIDCHATCFPTRYELSPGAKERNLSEILDYGHCVKAEQKARIGRWSCRILRTAGIRQNENGRMFAGAIAPEVDDYGFFATISEIRDEEKRTSCERNEYGLNWALSTWSNLCLANFKVELSPRLDSFHYASDSFSFDGELGSKFVLYGTGDFVLFRSPSTRSSSVSQGRCEKMN